MLLTLLDRVIEEADAAAGGVLVRLAEDPRARWRELIHRFHETFGAHRARGAGLRRGARHQRRGAPAVGRGAGTLGAGRRGRREAERRRGAAPDGLPARDLAIALTSMNERVWYATFAADGPAVAERDVVDVLLDVWLTSVYRGAVPPAG